MMIHQATGGLPRHKRRMRVGRGHGAGKGKTCGRGHKGCNARSGGGVRRGYEGGQMPIFRRVPKRGFSNALFRKEYQIVNVGDLQHRFKDGMTVDGAGLAEAGLVRHPDRPIKVLGHGDLSTKLTVVVDKFSKCGAEKITAAGGEARSLES